MPGWTVIRTDRGHRSGSRPGYLGQVRPESKTLRLETALPRGARVRRGEPAGRYVPAAGLPRAFSLRIPKSSSSGSAPRDSASPEAPLPSKSPGVPGCEWMSPYPRSHLAPRADPVCRARAGSCLCVPRWGPDRPYSAKEKAGARTTLGGVCRSLKWGDGAPTQDGRRAPRRP